MKKLILFLITTLLLSCSESSNESLTNFVPQRYLGTYKGTITERQAKILENRMFFQTDDKDLTITNGTVTYDEGGALCRIEKDDYEVVLLKQGTDLGISVFKSGQTVISEYYESN